MTSCLVMKLSIFFLTQQPELNDWLHGVYLSKILTINAVQNEQPNALDIPYSSAPKQLDHGGRLMMEAPAKKKARKTQSSIT
ncbi:hypothetical protein MJO28_008587 [Puccinia striiformis f. sp. tritici]|uniref:Uncharacterized protein n=1 Tax=Puccinia striiformis f. sp. tritici TaxID=168172 RepID=A0ACC0ECM0_9BASI|nr:hypothetical protein MJO28_008587 [Puccinia striiformis f. sp. tritici]KAI9604565.1 hypothetical protein KEM48_002456 [Puccinia striiformis f. sp. tritici PST-130]